jgi:hypothetical protein
MEPVAPESEASDRPNPIVVIAALGVGVLVVAFVISRWRRGVIREVADVAGESVVILTEALIDEVLAS